MTMDKELTAQQVEIIKKYFENYPSRKILVIQGHVSTLIQLSYMIGIQNNYSVIQKNLKQII